MTVRKRRRELVLAAGAILLLGVGVYAGSLSGGFLNWDDHNYLTENPEMERPLHEALPTTWTRTFLANWSPLHLTANLLLWHAGDGSPTVFRITNLALHLLAAFLLYLVLAEWLGRRLPALAAAALFVVHPANVENVAWISELKTLLATTCAFGAVHLYLRGARGDAQGTPLALMLFALGLLAKTSIVVLPALFVLLDLSMRRRPSVRRYALFATPAAIMAVVQIVATHSVGTMKPLHGGSALAHAATVIGAIPRFLAGALFPVGVAPHHPFDPVVSATDPRLLAGLLVLTAAAAITFFSWRGERRFFVAVPWFLAVLLPTLVVPIPIIYTERYLYLAMPFLFGAVAATLLERPRLPHWVGGAVLLGFGAWCAVSAAGYARSWRDSTSLWTTVTRVHPDYGKGWGMLAWSRLEAGDPEGAGRAFERYLRICPGDLKARVDRAVAEYGAGRPAAAARILEEVVADAPETSAAWTRLARIRELAKDEKGALEVWERAVVAQPENAGFWRSLAECRLRAGGTEKALAALDHAARLDPGDAPTRRRLRDLRTRLANE